MPETEIRRDAIVQRRPVCTPLGKRKRHVRLDRDRRGVRFAADLKANELAGFNRLSLRACNRSAFPILVEMVLSGASGKGGKGSLRLFSGGREVLPPGQDREIGFPAGSFGFSGRDRGWENISRIALLCKPERGHRGDEPPDVVLSALYGECRSFPPGPRLTEMGLALRLEKSRFVMASPSPEARLSEGPVPPPHDDPEGSAEEILAGQIMGRRLPFPIPWDFSPDGNHEWTHFLNRHHFLRPVGLALVRTGDERYHQFIREVVSDWIRKNPVPLDSNGGAGPSWETLSAAWRIHEWLRLKESLWHSPSGPGEIQQLILRSFWEHCRHLMDHRGHPNNWIIVESAALALAGMEVPVFKESPRWQAEGLSRLTHEIGRQFMDDGVHFEYSPLYHALCLHVLLDVKRTAGIRGIALPAEFDAPLERAADYLGAICRPDFTWPSLNDSGGVSRDYAAVMRLAGETFGREDFIWLGTKGEQGCPPLKKAASFRSAGIAVMRSGWHPGADFLLFRAGPPGMTHIHEDCLSLEIGIAGLPCLVDPGVTAYAPGPFSHWYRSAAAHNMILVDGKGPLRSGLTYRERIEPAGKTFFFSEGDEEPLACGVCRWDQGDDDGPPLTVTRTAASAPGGGWIITDAIEGTGNHAVTVCWQLFPGRGRYNSRTGAFRYENASGSGGCTLLLMPGAPRPAVVHSRGRLRPLAGWVSIGGRDVPADHLRFTFVATLPLALKWEIRPPQGCRDEDIRRQQIT